MAINDRHLNDIICTTLERFKNNLGNYLTRGNPFLSFLKSKGHFNKFNGGTETRETFVSSGSVVNNFNAYTTLSIANASYLGTARFPVCNLETHYTMSLVEKRENTGEEAVIKLVKRKLEIALESLKNEVDDQLFSAGTFDATTGVPKTIPGLAYIIVSDPTTGTMGDVDRSKVTIWRNQKLGMKSFTGATVYAAIKDIVRACDYKTDLIIAGANVYDAYESYLQAQKSIVQTKSIVIGDAAFSGLEYNNIPVLTFKNCQENRLYALNMKNLFFNVDAGAFFTQLEGQHIPGTVDAYWYPIVMRCNLSTNDPSSQGLVYLSA